MNLQKRWTVGLCLYPLFCLSQWHCLLTFLCLFSRTTCFLTHTLTWGSPLSAHPKNPMLQNLEGPG